jgi:hypothetical protein
VRRASGGAIGNSFTIFINSIQAVDNIAPAQVTFTIEPIPNAEVVIKSVEHSSLRRNGQRSATTAGGIGNRGFGRILFDVFVRTDKVFFHTLVTLNTLLDFPDAVNGSKLSVVLLLERNMTGVPGRKANLLGNVRILQPRRVLRGLGQHVDVG